MLKNKKTTVAIILLLVLVMSIFNIRYVKYDNFIGLNKIPYNIEFMDRDDWKYKKKLMDKYGLRTSTEMNKHFLRKNEYYLKSDDVINIQYLSDSLTIISSGPNTLDSGIRLFLYPLFSKLRILNTENLSVIKTLNFKGVIIKASIVNDTIFFVSKYEGKPTYGKVILKCL